jgi:regulatory protein
MAIPMFDTPPPKRIPPMTRQRLERAALAYVQRFASSTAMLRQVLARKLRRAADQGALDDATAGYQWADEIVATLQAKGLVNDRLYAEAKATSLHRRGLGKQRIVATLAQKGLDETDTRAALAQVMTETQSDTTDALDRRAAWMLARKRRLGPFAPAETRAARRARDLAVLGRAGFSYELARSVIDASDDDAAIGAERA